MPDLGKPAQCSSHHQIGIWYIWVFHFILFLCVLNWFPPKVSKGLEYLHSKSIVHLDLKVLVEIFWNLSLTWLSVSQKTLSWLKEVDRLSKSLTLEQQCSFEKGKRYKKLKFCIFWMSGESKHDLVQFSLVQGAGDGWYGRICGAWGLFLTFNHYLSLSTTIVIFITICHFLLLFVPKYLSKSMVFNSILH